MAEEIFTQRLRLRPFKRGDLPDVSEIRSHEDVYKWMVTGKWTTLSDAEPFAEAALSHPERLYHSISLLDRSGLPPQTPTVIGVIGMNQWDGIFFMFHPAVWGKGYAVEACHAFIELYFRENSDRETMEGSFFEGHVASRRVLEKTGFVYSEERTRETVALLGEVDPGFLEVHTPVLYVYRKHSE
ncbi:acyl-CoA N-acyltransferase [Aulographum hederae CBS 113979]|uniref:Acyl-CoA N-acyltransferase n=1 Tax=Aulographum hederae CBS 113979 TaxID=1176131 RepID=A0A6G1GTG7_9PEZI|nr:acyl-CoA N-acyltransferase [Aulographum hederae CBS 113979]